MAVTAAAMANSLLAAATIWCLFSGSTATSAPSAGDKEFPLLMPKAHPKSAESYLCTPVRLDEDSSYFVVGFRPNASQHTAHHMLIYGCEAPGHEDKNAAVWNCGEMSMGTGEVGGQPCKAGSKAQILYAWAMDAPGLTLPEGVGFRVGKGSEIQYLVLQVHYASVDHIPASGDDSGVFVEFTTEEQPKVAGVLLLGTGGMAPPHSTTFFETACEIEDERVIHPFAFRAHTHSLGKVVSGWRVRNRSQWDLLGKRDPQKPQMFYPVDDDSMEIKKGDIVAARCTMVNDRNWPTYIGATKEDEMCNFYLMYWLEGGSGQKPISPSTCFTQGPPLWSWGGWEYGAALKNVPEEAASTL